MKVIQYKSFGHSDVLQQAEKDKPSPKQNEVLIKISATTVNPFEIKVREGFLKGQLNIEFPYIPGSDFAGVVEAAGSAVSLFKVGDEVFATVFGGTYSEYITMAEDQVTIKPKNVSLNEAVALAVPLTTAHTLFIQEIQLKANERVLIHGAAGAVGRVLIQMAKAMGAYVVTTSSGKSIELVKALGADETIDYKLQDFTTIAKDIDLVIDMVGGETQTKSFTVLKKGGVLLSIVMPPSEDLAKEYGVTARFVNSTPSATKLSFGKKLVEQGKIKPHIAKIMKLEEAAEAQDLVWGGGLDGKLVLEV